MNGHLRSTPALRKTQKDKKIYVDLPRVSLTHMYLVYLGLIRGIHKSDLSIPRIELACHSSSEVSTVDLYLCDIFVDTCTIIKRHSMFLA